MNLEDVQLATLWPLVGKRKQRRGLCRARAQKLRKGRCVTLNALALRLLCAVELHVPNNAL